MLLGKQPIIAILSAVCQWIGTETRRAGDGLEEFREAHQRGKIRVRGDRAALMRFAEFL